MPMMKQDTTDSAETLGFCRRRANSGTFQSTRTQRHIIPCWNPTPPPTFLEQTLADAHKKACCQKVNGFCSLPASAHACVAAPRCNPRVVSPSCQGPICLHYHHTAGGNRSVGARGNGNASLSPNNKKKNKTQQLRCPDVCHVNTTRAGDG